jgi:hypothetical protein
VPQPRHGDPESEPVQQPAPEPARQPALEPAPEPARRGGGNPLDTAVEGWRRFWFAPQPMATLGLVRIAFSALMLGWSFSLLPDLRSFFGPDGVQPTPPGVPFTWGLLHVWQSAAAAYAVWGALVVAAVALLFGWHSRLAAFVVFVCVLSFERREPFIFNSGDGLVRIEALFLALAPAGAALSLDRRRTAGSFWDVSVRAPWALRLMQVQLSVIYLATVHDKITGVTWNNGTATSYSLRLHDLINLPLPTWLIMNPLLMNLMTWGTLALELAIGVLVWHRRYRPWVLAGGVLLHGVILLTLMVGFFTFAIFVLYLSFTTPETAQRWVERLRGVRPSRDGADAGTPGHTEANGDAVGEAAATPELANPLA